MLFAFPLEEGVRLILFFPFANFLVNTLEQLFYVDVGVELMEIFHDFGHFGLRVEGNELFLLNFLLAVLMSERWFIWSILLLFGFDQGFDGAI